MVTAVLYIVLKKNKNLIDWVSMPPSGRTFLFCAYVTARKKHNGYGIFQFFSMVGVLGSPGTLAGTLAWWLWLCTLVNYTIFKEVWCKNDLEKSNEKCYPVN